MNGNKKNNHQYKNDLKDIIMYANNKDYNKRKVNISSNFENKKEKQKKLKLINIKFINNNNTIKNILKLIIIIIYSIECISTQKERKLKNINLLNEITITIKGKGDQYIISNEYAQDKYFCDNISSRIYINGDLQEYKGKIVYNLEDEENTIKMEFDDIITNCKVMFYNLPNITKIDLSNFDSSNVTNMYKMFQGCISLTSIILNNFDTSSVINMEDMFAGCTSLQNLNVNNFNTSSVTSFNSMFHNCKSLKSLNLSNFDTSSVTSLNSMFRGCRSLESLNINNFNTSLVINMESMFQNCDSLKSLYMTNFNTSSVTNMNRMFASCYSLISLDLNNFNTSNVINMEFMFFGCKSLTSINLNNFQTSSVKNMNSMFFGCSSLKLLNLFNFNTSSVTDMSQMFKKCKSLISLNIDNFDTSLVTNMNEMFSDCMSLISLNLNNFETTSIINLDGIFNNCGNLLYCINETKTPNNISELLSSSPNYINNCSNICFDDFNKIKLNEMKKCFYNCFDDVFYKYEYIDNMCFQYCPNGTHYSYKNNNYICEENGNCNLIDYFNNICEINNYNNSKLNNIIINITTELTNGSLNKLISDIIYKNKTDLIIRTNNYIYQLTSSENQNNNEYNISTIKLGECENILKNHYNISKDISLLIFKIDYYEERSSKPIIEYEIFHPLTKEKLDLTLCQNITIDTLISVLINEDELFKYNLSSDYYNDICFTYTTEKGTDIILNDRKNEYYNNNLSLCEENCEYKGYDLENKKALCGCEVKVKLLLFSEITINKEKLIDNFINLKNEINFYVMKCINLMFSKEGLLKNIGSYILLSILLLNIILVIIYKIKGYKLLLYKIIDLINKYQFNELEKIEKSNKIINKNKGKENVKVYKRIISEQIKNNPLKKSKSNKNAYNLISNKSTVKIKQSNSKKKN